MVGVGWFGVGWRWTNRLQRSDLPDLEPLAVGENSVILLHPPLPLAGVSIETMRECQQNDSLTDGHSNRFMPLATTFIRPPLSAGHRGIKEMANPVQSTWMTSLWLCGQPVGQHIRRIFNPRSPSLLSLVASALLLLFSSPPLLLFYRFSSQGRTCESAGSPVSSSMSLSVLLPAAAWAASAFPTYADPGDSVICY